MSVNVLRYEKHGESIAIFAVQNPVSMNMINLVPAIEVSADSDASRVADWLEKYCRESAKVGLDPKVIDASAWRDGEAVGA